MTEKERVAEHLNLLSIFHYVYAALLSFGMCAGAFYMAMGGFVTAAIRADPKAPPGTEMVGGVFAVIGAAIALFALTSSVCCFLSGRWLRARRNRTFSQIVAGFLCLNVPLGTVLGVFTFVVLGKAEAEELYREAESAA